MTSGAGYKVRAGPATVFFSLGACTPEEAEQTDGPINNIFLWDNRLLDDPTASMIFTAPNCLVRSLRR